MHPSSPPKIRGLPNLPPPCLWQPAFKSQCDYYPCPFRILQRLAPPSTGMSSSIPPYLYTNVQTLKISGVPQYVPSKPSTSNLSHRLLLVVLRQAESSNSITKPVYCHAVDWGIFCSLKSLHHCSCPQKWIIARSEKMSSDKPYCHLGQLLGGSCQDSANWLSNDQRLIW